MAPSRSADAKERGRRLALALQVRGVAKQDALAFELGVHPSAISRWKEGGTISLAHAAALCRRLGISLDWLVFGQGAMELDSPAGQIGPAALRDADRLLASFGRISSRSIRRTLIALIEELAQR